MTMLIKTLAVVAAGTVLATSAFAQSAREVRGARIIAIALLVIALVLSSSTAVRAQEMEKANADAEFLTKVVPSIAASVKIIEYAQKNASVEKVREFARRVLKQHKGVCQNRERARQAAQDRGRYQRGQGQQGDDRQAVQAQGVRARCLVSRVVEQHSS